MAVVKPYVAVVKPRENGKRVTQWEEGYTMRRGVHNVRKDIHNGRRGTQCEKGHTHALRECECADVIQVNVDWVIREENTHK